MMAPDLMRSSLLAVDRKLAAVKVNHSGLQDEVINIKS